MTRYSLVKRFISDVYDLIESEGTQEDAYEAAERKYKEETGSRVFKNYDSFKSSKHFHWKKGQHLP